MLGICVLSQCKSMSSLFLVKAHDDWGCYSVSESVGSWPPSAGCSSVVGPRSQAGPHWPVGARVTLARSKAENLGVGMGHPDCSSSSRPGEALWSRRAKGGISAPSWWSQSLLSRVSSLGISALGTPCPVFRRGGRNFTGFILGSTGQDRLCALCGIRLSLLYQLPSLHLHLLLLPPKLRISAMRSLSFLPKWQYNLLTFSNPLSIPTPLALQLRDLLWLPLGIRKDLSLTNTVSQP